MTDNIQNTHITVDFFTPKDVGPRDWGREILVAHSKGKYTGKILKMNAGTKGGFQKHRVKDETGHLVSGELLVRFDNGDGKISEHVMKAGESVYIPAGAVHQEEAITDCVIFETSTPVFDDRIRMEESYGLKIEGGLPTTENPRIE
jgi:mannose-6-phosphate isomerase-like protein (cupin superfamily)